MGKHGICHFFFGDGGGSTSVSHTLLPKSTTAEEGKTAKVKCILGTWQTQVDGHYRQTHICIQEKKSYFKCNVKVVVVLLYGSLSGKQPHWAIDKNKSYLQIMINQ